MVALVEKTQMALHGIEHEIILVDDASPADDWSEIQRLVNGSRGVRGIKLSRNFGQQAAITAGLQHAKDDLVSVIDCDLQDPPEEIPRMIALMKSSGRQIIFGERINRKKNFRSWGAAFFFRFLNLVSGVNLDGRHGAFTLITRQVTDAYLRIGEGERHYVFILKWLGFSYETHPYEVSDRFSGKSSYSLSALIRHAISGIMFQTDVFLRHIIKLGFLITMFSVFFALYLVLTYFTAAPPPGWTSLAVLISFFSGLIIFNLGIVSLYLGSIFLEVKRRPLFVVETEI